MVLLPQLLFADTDCWVKEYPDHYLAVCTGDEKAEPVPRQSPAMAQPAAATQPITPRQGSLQKQSNTADAVNTPRFRRMSRSRVGATISARNRLLREGKLTPEGP